MNEVNELILLYDYYGEFLSETQQNYFEDYYFNNLSLSEIADNKKVSRNAVHKQLKTACDKLNDFENKLKIVDKTKKIENIVQKITDDKIKNEIINILEK